MPLTISGIKLHDVWVGLDDEGKEKVTAHYQLLTTDGRAIGAKESLSSGKGYNENTFIPNADTIKALKDAVALYKRDVEASIGLSAG